MKYAKGTVPRTPPTYPSISTSTPSVLPIMLAAFYVRSRLFVSARSASLKKHRTAPTPPSFKRLWAALHWCQFSKTLRFQACRAPSLPLKPLQMPHPQPPFLFQSGSHSCSAMKSADCPKSSSRKPIYACKSPFLAQKTRLMSQMPSQLPPPTSASRANRAGNFAQILHLSLFFQLFPYVAFNYLFYHHREERELRLSSLSG